MPFQRVRWLCAVAPLFLAACGSSAALKAADAGDVDGLRASLAERKDVGRDEAQDIARALMTRTIEGAQGPAGARSLEAMGPLCADRFDAALARRAAHDDELAAQAEILRMESGRLGALSHARLVSHAEPHWRAVGVRSLREPFHPGARGGEARELERASLWRRKAMEDPALMVRRAAIAAAAEARDPSDVKALLEAARLDPDEASRRGAIVALGAVGSREAVMGLRDLWAQADEKTRLAIVEAWKTSHERGEGPCSSPPQSSRCVARHQLQRVAESDGGMVTLAAALALVSGHGPDDSDSVVGNAAAVVERLIDTASTRVRAEAIEKAPLSWAHLTEAIVEATKSPDEVVAAAALGRVAELGGDEREPALKKLRLIAKERGMAGEAARKALAQARDTSAAGLVATDAKAASPSVRREAASRLVRLGSLEHAVPLLADRDPTVRAVAACSILAMDE